jgi:hypothetical protein
MNLLRKFITWVSNGFPAGIMFGICIGAYVGLKRGPIEGIITGALAGLIFAFIVGNPIFRSPPKKDDPNSDRNPITPRPTTKPAIR